ncbi:hypothetical protein [Streptomyces coerulescens]|uniref:Band 7 domain-containing protein n=1 Tax=Streptomyces coerulescens TaxID=29304 RepID=A0ABW0CGW1_STRCD
MKRGAALPNDRTTPATADIPEMPAPHVREFRAHSVGGGAAPAVGGQVAPAVTGVLVIVASVLAMCGLNMVAPGEARVIQLFGRYRGTIRQDGLRWVNLEYPYDAHDEGDLSLRGNAEEITEKLAVELHARVEAAGVQIIESRVTHLAYAPEIASAMLQRQQAGAVVAARRQIVDGAVGMVEAALARISEQEIVELDEECKAAMVSNLMVVLCGDRAPQPVLNTGTLYQ